MLNESKGSYWKLSITGDHSSSLNTKSGLFFFKFMNLSVLKDCWKPDAIFIPNYNSISRRSFQLKLNKKKKYKPYSTFKFDILRYRRVFDPKYFYNFNRYLFNRHSYRSLTGYNYVFSQHKYEEVVVRLAKQGNGCSKLKNRNIKLAVYDNSVYVDWVKKINRLLGRPNRFHKLRKNENKLGKKFLTSITRFSIWRRHRTERLFRNWKLLFVRSKTGN